MIQAFLVDDEEHALHILELFLTRIGGVEVIGRSSNGFDTLQQLQTLQADVIFLDIEMPEMNGIELAERIRSNDPHLQIIFATAYDQYAIHAFEHAAIDYILKPLEMDRLTKTVARIQREKDKLGTRADYRHEQLQQEESSNSSRLHIQMLGTFTAKNEAGVKLKWRTSKEKELLAYLSLQHQHRAHRDQIIEDMWPDEDYNKAKVYLHTCISLIRRNLKALELEHILKYENERYYLDVSRIDVDVTQFKQLTVNTMIDSLLVEDLEAALSHVHGSLLREEDYVWSGHEAESLDKAIGEWRLILAEKYYAQGDYEQSVRVAEEAIDLFLYDERAYRLIMKCYQCMGENDQVHIIYTKLLNRLKELQIKPSEATIQLYDQICK